ncbi:MAG: WbuC family cupin fold metalloprotein [Chloroflexia bacterium]
MSQRVPLSDNALALRPIDRTLIDTVALQARDSPRHRAILRYHELPEPVQRMLNALDPESYVQPHRHAAPPKVEAFLVLRGRAMLVRFDDAGHIIEAVEIAAGGPTHGAEVPPGAWHTLLALDRAPSPTKSSKGRMTPQPIKSLLRGHRPKPTRRQPAPTSHPSAPPSASRPSPPTHPIPALLPRRKTT